MPGLNQFDPQGDPFAPLTGAVATGADTLLALRGMPSLFDAATATLMQGTLTVPGLACACAPGAAVGTTDVVVTVPAPVMAGFGAGYVAGVLAPTLSGVPQPLLGFGGTFAAPAPAAMVVPLIRWAVGMPPRLVASYQDSQGRVTLAFAWPLAQPAAPTTQVTYSATLWADAERTTMLGGPSVQTATPDASFSGVVPGAAFLLDVFAMGTDGSVSGPLCLMATTNGGGLNPLLPAGNADVPAQETVGAALFGERPYYGSVGGVKRWARIVTYGNARQEVSDLDLLYFLMGASDVIDSHLFGMYQVPLVKYRDPGYGTFRFPPGISFQCDRLAAAMLIQARKSNLTEDVSGYANTLEQGAMTEVVRLAQSMSLPGQSLGASFAFDVSNSNPRQFAMPGDAAGTSWSQATGYADMRSFRQAELPYSRVSWRYGGGWGGTQG